MRIPTADLRAALKQKRTPAGESSRPPKKARREEQDRPTPGAEALEVPVAAEDTAAAPIAEAPAKQPSSEPVRTEEMEVAAAAEAVDEAGELTRGAPASAETPEAEQTAATDNLPVAAESGAEQNSPPAEAPEIHPPTATEKATGGPGATGAGPKGSGEKRKETGEAPRRPEICPGRPRVEGPQEKDKRPGPVLKSMSDAGESLQLLTQIPTHESVQEVRQLSTAAIVDMLAVSMVQTVNGVLGLREVIARSSGGLGHAIERATKYKKRHAALSQRFSRLCDESKAREEDLRNKARDAEMRAGEAERRASEAERRVSVVETERDVVCTRMKATLLRSEEQDRQLQYAQEQMAAAREEVVAMKEKVAAAEKAAAEASLERAGAVSFADEANARAAEAEARAWEAENLAREAETKVQQAEARANKAVEDYKSSPEFKNEVIEGSLGAFISGFDVCKEKISKAFKLNGDELEKIQPEDHDEEEEEEGEGGTAGAHKA